jgi:uncharacterized protein YprB with RNaseH-like and TPR domain
MSSIKQDRFAGLNALRPAPVRSALGPSRELTYVPDDSGVCAWGIPEHAGTLAQLLGASPVRNRFGEHLSLRCWFPDPSEVPDPAALRLLAPDADLEVADPRQWLFLDTETTGLAGGTGTYAFLVGIAWWDSGGIQVEQFLMRELSEETSLLAELAERMAERRVLVTFNGKSFDWPLLETRYRMTRQIAPPAPRAHLDLLHPARSLWRLRLGSVRLAELERHVLGWDRGADILSEMIPRIYFDFLRGGAAEPLVPVVTHNQMDLRGLARLSCRVLALLAQPERCGEDGLEVYGVSRICERRGETARARELYQHSIASPLPAEVGRAARISLARLAKRQGDLGLACKLWEEILGDSREGFVAYEQLAMYYEHNARQPERAASLVHEALAKLHQARRLGGIEAEAYRRQCAAYKRRLDRLQRKSSPRTLYE